MTTETTRTLSTDQVQAIASCSQILGALYLQDPKQESSWPLLDELRERDSLEDWPFGSSEQRAQASALIHEGLASTSYAALAREYQRLFIGPHHFEAPAWGSVYLDKDQVLFGCSTLELRQWMRANGIAITEEKREPEDHIGKMLVLLGWLAREKPALIPEYLGYHVMTWASRYLELLRHHAQNPFYEGLALLTEITLDGLSRELEVVPRQRPVYR
ncbi:MAG: Tat proofreading chaperone DmsD [Coriobacteriales bacterium]|nr:Tat proofreading chaperone DmsD [Coriobacteriales bacterium]